ncbi:hypothetical protein F4824DRAFT_98071 [Ustulina deusta]|nr:hypothetical protein F4824DRAFT_98071 [Ustulina deusta]
MSSQLRYRTGQNVCSASCPVGHINIPGDKIKKPSAAWPDIRGLNSLNYSRDKWLTGDAIEVAIATYCRGLPQALQDEIGLGIPGINPKVWHRGPRGDDALAMAINVPAKRALARLKTTEYSIFPICMNGDHWVLVIMHKSPRRTGEGGEMEWSHVEQVAVLDPYRDGQTMTLVSNRLRYWLTQAGNFTYSGNYTRIVWVPMQKDATSCGPRAYWHAKQLMDRLLELHENEIKYAESLWNDLSGWFNEHFVRGEMMGRCAWDAVRAMDYKARIAVECVNRVREYEHQNETWAKADRLMRPPNFSNMKPETRPRPHARIGAESPASAGADYGDDIVMGGTPLPSTPVQKSWKPPVPVPNQHKIAPDVVFRTHEVIPIDDSDSEEDISKIKGPAYLGPQPMTPPSSAKPTTPKLGYQTSTIGTQTTMPEFKPSVPAYQRLTPVKQLPTPGIQTPEPVYPIVDLTTGSRASKAGKHILDLTEEEILMGPKKKKGKTETGFQF